MYCQILKFDYKLSIKQRKQGKRKMRDETARFGNLNIETHYDIVDGWSGHFLTEGIQGCEAMNTVWPVGAEAYEVGSDDIVEIADGPDGSTEPRNPDDDEDE